MHTKYVWLSIVLKSNKNIPSTKSFFIASNLSKSLLLSIESKDKVIIQRYENVWAPRDIKKNYFSTQAWSNGQTYEHRMEKGRRPDLDSW